MRPSGYKIAILIFLRSTLSLGAPDPTLHAADYYFSHQDYVQAFPLWKQILKNDPDNVSALGKICEMRLILEGRAACRESLQAFVSGRWSHANLDSRRVVKDYYERFETVFLTDEGQTAFLIGQSLATAREFAGALGHIQRADSLEQGNARVLRLKAVTEKRLKKFDALSQTLAKLREVHPFDETLIEDQAEVLYYQREFNTLIAMMKGRGEDSLSPRLRLAYGLALAETDHVVEAATLLAPLSEKGRSPFHPRVWLFRAKLARRSAKGQLEAIESLKSFLAALERPDSLMIDGWDPYRSVELKEAATNLLSEMERPAVREKNG